MTQLRYVVKKPSGSHYASVIDSETGKVIKRYRVTQVIRGIDGWGMADMHRDALNKAALETK
ncbi:hypothetical protein [Nitrosospira multiformis]|uniref:hypothetical protein n=1 Tax=Nitrosospira multiformis TaxID=1231 RepID=UPI0009428948|nr:hypothetical protein [Nitrosospira multiformis]